MESFARGVVGERELNVRIQKNREQKNREAVSSSSPTLPQRLRWVTSNVDAATLEGLRQRLKEMQPRLQTTSLRNDVD